MAPASAINYLAWSSVALFFISLWLPAFTFSPDAHVDPNDLPGFLFLMLGWLAILHGVPAWLANPAWLVAVISLFRARFRMSAIYASIAVLVALTSVFVTRVPFNEAGSEAKVAGMGVGYFVWLFAVSIPLAAALYALRKQPNNGLHADAQDLRAGESER
jgi:hypothetical protein